MAGELVVVLPGEKVSGGSIEARRRLSGSGDLGRGRKPTLDVAEVKEEAAKGARRWMRRLLGHSGQVAGRRRRRGRGRGPRGEIRFA